ncbi:hypothetical protein EJB05_36692, partial [Eragrostis curvula]
MPPPPLVVDVWADNQDAEVARIHGLLRDFDIAAVATSYDVPAGPFLPASPRSPALPRILESCYEAVRSRVDRVRFAQLGLALFNCDGELGGVWRFHLGDTAAGDARFLAGIGVDPARRQRADPHRVCRAVRESSRAIIPRGVWVTSDGADDVAYLVRHICGGRLPCRRDEFVHVCATSFPALYDLRVLAEWTTVVRLRAYSIDALSSWPLAIFSTLLLAMEELDEFEVLWPDTNGGPHEPAAKTPPEASGPPRAVHYCGLVRSRPVDVPRPARSRRWRDGGEEVEDGEAIVPPHLLLSGRRRSETAWTLRTPCTRARDMRRLRISVLRMTGFIEG